MIFDSVQGWRQRFRPRPDACSIAEDYDIFLPARGLPPLSIGNYTYTAIPKCYALLDTTALDASGNHPAAESAGACP